MSKTERLNCVLHELDRLLAVQSCSKQEKANALREVERTAKRMADQILRHLAQQP